MRATETMQSTGLSGSEPGWGHWVRGAAICAVLAGLTGVMAAQSLGSTDVFEQLTQDPNAMGAQNAGAGVGAAGQLRNNQIQNGRIQNNGGGQNNGAQNGPPPNQPPRPPAPPSEFQQMVEATTGKMLPIFGADLFSGVPSTFAPLNQVPVPTDYVLGPGDEVNLQIWGANTLTGRYLVDRTGSLELPSVGTVRVAGMTMSELQPFLKQQYDRLYKDVHLSVALGQLRAIQVFVVGYAVSPGTHTIGSLSTLVDALFSCGGPLPNGSLRDIQLKRGSETIVHFDLYDFLLHGDKSKSVPLQAGDTIFIPVVGTQVAVTGSVNAPAVYELRGETTVAQVLQLAGGESNVAAGADVRLERISEHAARSIETVKMADLPSATVRNGDIITVTPVINRFRDAVTLTGNVANPARYPWHPGMRVSELIPNRESLITRNYFERYNRIGQTEAPPRATTTPVEGVTVVPTTNGGGNPAQGGAAQGSTGQGSTAQGAPGPGAAGQGAPGQGSAVSADTVHNTTVAEALTQSNEGGFAAENTVTLNAPDIDWSYAVVERQNSTDLQTTLLPFNLGKLVLDGDQSQNLELQPGDVVRIFSKADIPVPMVQRTRYVQLSGEIADAGWYSVLPGETLQQLIARAGGLTPDAYLYGSQFTRQSTRRLQEQRLQEMADTLEQQILAKEASASADASTSSAVNQETLQSVQDARATVARLRRAVPNGRIALNLRPDSVGLNSLPADMSLEDGDRFVVPHKPDNVSVEGQVYNASAFLYRPGRRVQEYLKAAGGPNRDADRSRVFVLRADGSVTSNQYTKIDKAPVFAGDTIIVPPQLDRRSFLRNLVDASTVLTGLGVPLATLYLLAKQ